MTNLDIYSADEYLHLGTKSKQFDIDNAHGRAVQ